MGTPKALLPWQTLSFLESIYQNCQAAGISSVVIVTGFHDSIVRTAHQHLDAAWIKNPTPEHGMLSSIRCGLNALPSQTSFMLCLVDHPAVQEATYQILIDNARHDKIIIPIYSSRRGHPVIFGADFFPQLQEGDCPEGARSVLRAHPDALHEIPVHDPAILWDIDTPEEYNQYKPSRT